MNPSIDIQHLKKVFGKQVVLEDVNLTVKPGEIVGLIGPSGAGKSTVIKTMLGMEKADGGKALVLDTQMPNRKILGNIGYMAQSDALYESLSAKENLVFYGKMKGVDGQQLTSEIDHVAQVVDLTDDLTKRVSNFSGGMKRRLSLAIALLGDPDLLVLDEPTNDLDVETLDRPVATQEDLGRTAPPAGCRPQRPGHHPRDGRGRTDRPGGLAVGREGAGLR